MPRARYQAVVDLAWFRPAVTHLFADLADVTSARLSYTSAHNDLHILEYVMTSLTYNNRPRDTQLMQEFYTIRFRMCL